MTKHITQGSANSWLESIRPLSIEKDLSYLLHLPQASISSCHWERDAGFAQPLVSVVQWLLFCRISVEI